MVDEQWLINDIARQIDDLDYADLLNHATMFAFKIGIYGIITIKRRSVNKDGIKLWVVSNGGTVWNRNSKDFEAEPLPSSRSVAFDKRTAFTLDEAFQVLQYLRNRAIRHRKAIEKELEEMRSQTI